MKNTSQKLRSLWFLSGSIILFTIYYHIRPFLWGADLTIYDPMFELSLWGLCIWINIILELIGVFAVTYGFYHAKNWARVYTIALFFYSSFWNLYVLLILRAWPYERFGWLVFYVIVIAYLMMSNVLKYFKVKKFFI